MNILFDKVRDGKVVLGVAVMYPASGIIEAIAKGWDFVWIDTQHGEIAYHEALHAMQAADGCQVPTVLRVASHETGVMSPMADLGPAALMVPMVANAAQARSIVQAAHFPPRGNRSYGGRRLIDLHGREYYKEREMMVVAQIETLEAVDNAEQIIAVDGIDMLFFGPDDMRAQMGLPINTPVLENDRLKEAMKRTAEAAHRAGKWAGSVAVTPPALVMAVEMGYQLLVGGADAAFLRITAADKLAELRKTLAEKEGAAPVPAGDPQSSGGIYGR